MHEMPRYKSIDNKVSHSSRNSSPNSGALGLEVSRPTAEVGLTNPASVERLVQGCGRE